MNFRTSDFYKNVISKRDSMITLDEEQIRALQEIILEMMDDIVTVCENNNISYALSGGTLIGAVRHKGFIPWDDDADIDIPRSDIKKFLTAFIKEYGSKYWIHIPGNTKEFGSLNIKIRKKGTIYRINEEEKRKECGVIVDIFIVENTYDNCMLRKLHEVLCTMAQGAVSCRVYYQKRYVLLKLAEGYRDMLFLFKLRIALGFLISWIPVHIVVGIADSVFAMCKNHHSKSVTIPPGRKKFKGELFLRKDYCEYIKADFAGRKYSIPIGYDYILSRLYGDYMRVPDADKREKRVVSEIKL